MIRVLVRVSKYPCKECGAAIGRNSRTRICTPCRVRLWHIANRERVSAIKQAYVIKHPDKRKQSWSKYNHEHKDRRADSNAKWYDKAMFSGKRKILLSTHPYCARCGATGRLHVHHRDGIGTTSPVQNNAWDNLVVLCPSCHSTVHTLKIKPFYVGK